MFDYLPLHTIFSSGLPDPSTLCHVVELPVPDHVPHIQYDWKLQPLLLRRSPHGRGLQHQDARYHSTGEVM